jgi:hypothetical protein
MLWGRTGRYRQLLRVAYDTGALVSIRGACSDRGVCKRGARVESVPDSEPRGRSNDERHPTPERPRLLPRFSSRQQGLAHLARQEGARTIAASLASCSWQYGAPMFTAASDEEGLSLDPETHLLQRVIRARSPSYRKLPYGRRRRLDPEREAVDSTSAREFVSTVMAGQRDYGASIIRPPYLRVGAAGTRGRDLDFLLQETGARLFASEGIEEPNPLSGSELPRELHLTIAIALGELQSRRTCERLVSEYASLPGSGFWVRIENFDETTAPSELWAGARFLFELEAATGRTVIACCPGNLAAPLLASGLSVSIGIAGGERFHLPTEAVSDDGFVRFAYHPDLFRSFQLAAGKVKGETSKRVFTALGCDCGEHPEHEPPTNRQVDRHTLKTRVRAARELAACRSDPAAQGRLRSKVVEATHLAAELNVESLSLAAADAVLSAARGEQPQTLSG